MLDDAVSLLGCAVPTGDLTVPPVPAIDLVSLHQAGQATAYGWSGLDGRVDVTTTGLAAAGTTATLRLAATRVTDLDGRLAPDAVPRPPGR